MDEWYQEMANEDYRAIILKFKEENSDRAAVLISMHFLIEQVREAILRKLPCIPADKLGVLIGDSPAKSIRVAYRFDAISKEYFKAIDGMNRIRNLMGHTWTEDIHDAGADKVFREVIPVSFHHLYSSQGGKVQLDNRDKWLRLWYDCYKHVIAYKGMEG